MECIWRGKPGEWYREPGVRPVAVLAPVTAVLVFLVPGVAFWTGVGVAVFAWRGISKWTNTRRLVVAVEVDRDARQLLVRSRSGKTHTYSLDKWLVVRPIQRGHRTVVVHEHEDDEVRETDEIVVHLDIAMDTFTLYHSMTTQSLLRTLDAFRGIGEKVRIKKVTDRRTTFYDVEADRPYG
ncbi:hypothetical protein [Saccharothrix violaceirubra]|uniref:Uncharacterized protein n=1 Tax=Saccharothrix violaceirubra TaxID=413306 RepID=A0A7W7T2I9_9PSEU|nr:hypothetical protein [Saccharothrix violaceirubra]MBB4965331.1 hypothetical protein [Saccharothrix violaceirubra]